MKILTKNNGIAMVAVMAVLVIVTLFIPVMFNMGDSALAMAVTGMDQQRASYLARSSVEMTVAAFKQSYNEFIEKVPSATAPEGETSEERVIRENRFKVYNSYKQLGIFSGEVDSSLTAIDFFRNNEQTIFSDTMYMYVNTDDEKTYEYRSVKTDSITVNGAEYRYVGFAECSFVFDDSVEYYKIDNETEQLVQLTEAEYNAAMAEITAILGSNQTAPYSISKVENRNIVFTGTANVGGAVTIENGKATATGGKSAVRRCIVVLPTYPSEEGWLFFNGEAEDTDGNKIADIDGFGADIIKDGCCQLQFKPERRSGMTALNYSELGINSYQAQVLQIYSCLGNMIVSDNDVQDKNGVYVHNGVQNSEFYLGNNPQLNTYPQNDPYYNVIKGINAASYATGVQKDNFIAITASNAVKVDIPVNLLVNPARANRLGDGFDKNKTIYKIMTFQSPTIYFARRVDMMISLYNNSMKDGLEIEGDARRMSSVVLAAPSNTPYNYYNKDRKQTCKAGMVYFAEDCYLWVINYGNNGSGLAPSWYEVASTVYYRDSDFTKVKIASAGDVCYFNTEVPLQQGDETKKIGLPLAGWALETIYYTNYNTIVTDATPWWQVWTRAKQAIFGAYIKGSGLIGALGLGWSDKIFVPSDLYKIGNIYEDPTVQIPDIDDFYTIWEN